MWAALETKIIERLREKLGPDVYVGPARDLERVRELRQKVPAAWVIYDGFNTGDSVADGAVQQIRQEWLIVLAAGSARGRGEVDAARDEAAELCKKALEALLGFHLGGGKYLQLQPAPGPEYDGGYCHVPLAFSNSATYKGQP